MHVSNTLRWPNNRTAYLCFRHVAMQPGEHIGAVRLRSLQGAPCNKLLQPSPTNNPLTKLPAKHWGTRGVEELLDLDSIIRRPLGRRELSVGLCISRIPLITLTRMHSGWMRHRSASSTTEIGHVDFPPRAW